MEQHSCSSVSLVSMLCAPLPVTVGAHTDNPIVRGSLRIWAQFRKHFGNVQALLSMPLSSNFLFKPSLVDTAFLTWARKGINSVGDLFVDGTFASFDYLVNKLSLPKTHFFRYLQVRDFVRS